MASSARCDAQRLRVVGPAKSDPAGVRSAADAAAAFRSIASKAAPRFISRGDDSGTNVFELHIWKRGRHHATRERAGTARADRAGRNAADRQPAPAPTRSRTAATYLAELEETVDLEILYRQTGRDFSERVSRHRRQPGETPEGQRRGRARVGGMDGAAGHASSHRSFGTDKYGEAPVQVAGKAVPVRMKMQFRRAKESDGTRSR